MSLVLAILLALYYFSRKSADSYKAATSKEARERWCNERFARRQAFIDKHLDVDIEDEIRYICENSCKEYTDMFKKLESYNIKPFEGMVYLALMAERGKIPEKFLEFGISNIACYADTPHKEQIEHAKNYLNFMKWYSNYAKEHGITDRMYFLPNRRAGQKEIWELNEMENKNILNWGSFVWESIDVACNSGRSMTTVKW